MMDPHNELKKVKSVCMDAEIWPEGGKDLIYMQGLKFHSDEKPVQMDALLYPYKYGGYDTRLFLEKPIPSKGQNWKTFSLCGRTWHACFFCQRSLPQWCATV